MANPLRHFKCNSTSGTTLIDSSDSAVNGTVSNASIWNANGKLNYCIYPNDLYAGQTASFGITGDWTVCAWFKMDATGFEFLWGNNTGGDDLCKVNGATSMWLTLNNSNKDFTVPTINLGTWYHVIITRAGSVTRLYINNVESSSGAGSNGVDLRTGVYLLGGTVGAVTDFSGYIDDVRFYDEVIDATERARIYNSGSGTETTNTPPPIVAPTVTTQAVSDIGTTTATGNGNITDTGGENCDKRGIVYGTSSQGDPGDVAPGSSGYDAFEEQAGSFGTGAFTRSLTGLDPGTKYYARAYAHNSQGYSYGGEVDFTLLPPETYTSGEKELRRHWPVEEGLTAKTQKQEGRQTNLVPEEESLVPQRIKVGL